MRLRSLPPFGLLRQLTNRRAIIPETGAMPANLGEIHGVRLLSSNRAAQETGRAELVRLKPNDGPALDAVARKVKHLDHQHDIPYLAGYSKDGNSIGNVGFREVSNASRPTGMGAQSGRMLPLMDKGRQFPE
ncbi:MAG: hypothetical protein ACTHJQ_02825 [Rhizobiaceae bacterium]